MHSLLEGSQIKIKMFSCDAPWQIFLCLADPPDIREIKERGETAYTHTVQKPRSYYRLRGFNITFVLSLLYRTL